MATKTINLNALDELQLAAKFQPQIVAIGQALVEAAKVQGTNKAAGETQRDTVKKAVVAYANETAAAGVPPMQANAALRTGLQEMGFPQGTALNYGRAVEGFRKIAETGKAKDGTPLALEKATLKDAQGVMESPETARKNQLRSDIGEYVKAASEAQLKDILDLVSGLGIKLKEKRGGRVTVTTPAPAEAPVDAMQEGQKAAA